MPEIRTQIITRLLNDLRLGDGAARDRLWDAVYLELHQLAQSHMAREANGRTLQPTALVHECYLRLMETSDGAFENRRHFFAAAATAMRRILVDDARRRGRVKRGGIGAADRGEPASRPHKAAAASAVTAGGEGAVHPSDQDAALRPADGDFQVGAPSAPRRRVELKDCAASEAPDAVDVLAVNEVMEALEREHPLLARVVELRFFAGLSGDQTAEAMDVSPRAVDNYWRAARAWLYGKLA